MKITEQQESLNEFFTAHIRALVTNAKENPAFMGTHPDAEVTLALANELFVRLDGLHKDFKATKQNIIRGILYRANQRKEEHGEEKRVQEAGE